MTVFQHPRPFESSVPAATRYFPHHSDYLTAWHQALPFLAERHRGFESIVTGSLAKRQWALWPNASGEMSSDFLAQLKDTDGNTIHLNIALGGCAA
jgi:hypothetical protein